MQSYPFYWVGVVVFELIAASCVGAISYALCRYIEARWKPPAFILDMLFLVRLFVVCHLLTIFWAGGVTFVWLAIYGVLMAVGGWFHYKSGGASKNWLVGFMAVGSACLLSFEVGIVPYYFPVFYPLLHMIFGGPYALGLLFYPILAPLALWIWRSLRVRPGVDEPLEEAQQYPALSR